MVSLKELVLYELSVSSCAPDLLRYLKTCETKKNKTYKLQT